MNIRHGLFFALLLTLCSGAVRSDIPPFSIRISIPEDTVKIGEIMLDIVLTNTSQKPFAVHAPPIETQGRMNYQVYVINANGTPVSKTEKAQKEEAFGLSGSMGIKELRPGDTEEEKIILNTLYEITSPGTYLVRVQRRDWGDIQGRIDVISNLLRVTVTQ